MGLGGGIASTLCTWNGSGLHSQLAILYVRGTAPAYIHNCQFFMYVKPRMGILLGVKKKSIRPPCCSLSLPTPDGNTPYLLTARSGYQVKLEGPVFLFLSCLVKFTDICNICHKCHIFFKEIDIDECNKNIHTCTKLEFEVCKNTVGSFECDCLDGYSRNEESLQCEGE